MSADGSTIVGSATEGRGFRWRRTGSDTEFTYIVAPKSPDDSCSAAVACHVKFEPVRPTSVSADGSVVAGGYVGLTPIDDIYCYQPFRWTSENGFVCIGDGREGEVRALSPDGTAAYAAFQERLLHRWTLDMGWQPIVPAGGSYWFLPEGLTPFIPFFAVAAEAPGLGCGAGGSEGGVLFDLEQGNVEFLGNIPDDGTHSYACGISANGSVVVGYGCRQSQVCQAYRWSRETGVVPLDDASIAYGVSRDGAKIVGEGPSNAFIWELHHGARSLKEVLETDYGLDLTGWTLRRAISITPDARTIAGTGRNPEGQTEAWIVDLGTPCNADWNADGAVNSADFFDFLDDFLCDAAECPPADFNRDQLVNSQDLFDFLTAFFSTC